ncbi:MAG: ABC transporter ATP-binding protein [bacterium]
MAILSIRGLSKTYSVGLWSKPVTALDDLNLEVEEGEIFGFLGPNGAGKTTTIKILLRIIYPTKGTAFLLGREIGEAIQHRQIGYMPENPYFYRFLTGYEFLMFYGRLSGLSYRERKKRAEELLDLVGLEHARDIRVGNYSKGMVTRVGLAQALLTNPQLLLMDEPMSGLDPIGRREIRGLIMQLREEKKTVFFCSHILADVETICDRVAILNRGRMIKTGTVAEILHEETTAVRVSVSKYSPELVDRLRAMASDARESGGLLHLRASDQTAANSICSACVQAGAVIHEMTPERGNLEDYFIREVGSVE